MPRQFEIRNVLTVVVGICSGVELGKVLAKQVRKALSSARKRKAPVGGFNSSTSRLLGKYLQSNL